MTLQHVTSALKGVLGESFNSWLQHSVGDGLKVPATRQNPSLLDTSRAQNGRSDPQSWVQ